LARVARRKKGEGKKRKSFSFGGPPEKGEGRKKGREEGKGQLPRLAVVISADSSTTCAKGGRRKKKKKKEKEEAHPPDHAAPL